MKNLTMKKMALSLCAMGVLFTSCEKENLEITTNIPEAVKPAGELVLNPSTQKSADVEMSENMGDIFDAVTPSECGPTAFRAVSNKYIQAIIKDSVALAENGIYRTINRYYSWFLSTGDQTFGAEGKYTSLMVKRQRELASFWNMPVEIKVNGEHTANLDKKEVWVETLSTFFGNKLPDGKFVYLTKEEASDYADYYLYLNTISPNLPENPFFATDGFASSNRTIVIGDGLVRWLAESGIEEGIVWTGILAHEWAHQIQFLNRPTWYPNGVDPDRATATRYTELEADFMAAYYMTHKLGATYNQKRVEEFFELFFQIGDCGFASPGHHGTPLQRMRAAQLGFKLAADAQVQGKMLTQQKAHEYFTAHVAGLL